MHFPSVVFSYGTYLYFFHFFEMLSCDGICSLAISLTKLLSSSFLSFFFRYNDYNGNTWEDNDNHNENTRDGENNNKESDGHSNDDDTGDDDHDNDGIS